MVSRSDYSPEYDGGYWHYNYSRNIIPRDITITEFYDLSYLKKNKLRSHDELVPKPTEINITEKVIKVPTLREHPYASHIPSCAVFPYSRSSDNASNNKVMLLKKTIGSPFRQELILKHTEPRVWPGQQGFYDFPKQMTGVSQVFYPTPPKTLCPNATLSARETALSPQNFHMFRSWEKDKYITTYQREYPGRRLEPLTSFVKKTTDNSTEEGETCTEEQLPPVDLGCAGEMGHCPNLLELQDSYSRSNTLRDFNRSTNETTVDRRDNMRTGKRCYFHGLCSQYFRNRTAVPLPVA